MSIWLYNKFKGSRKVSGPIQNSAHNIITAKGDSQQLVSGRKHFTPRNEGASHEWKPCLKIITPQPHSVSRLTDFPSETRKKSMYQLMNPSVKNKSVTLVKKNLFGDEKKEVRELEKWEKDVLNKPSVSDQYLKFRSQYRSILRVL